MKFEVTVCREWTEYGNVTIEAEDKYEAHDIVLDLLSLDDEEIEWGDMDPGKDWVENVMELGDDD